MRRQRPLIEWFSALERDFGLTLTLLCACHDHRLCHRSLLAELIANSPARSLDADDFDPRSTCRWRSWTPGAIRLPEASQCFRDSFSMGLPHYATMLSCALAR